MNGSSTEQQQQPASAVVAPPLCCQSLTTSTAGCGSGAMRSLLRPTLLLLSLLAPVLAVITSQGPWGERVEEEVREFTGWLHGGEQDYVMTLAQVFFFVFFKACFKMPNFLLKI